MPSVIETTTAVCFYGAEPSATAIASWNAHHRERLLAAKPDLRPSGATWVPLPHQHQFLAATSLSGGAATFGSVELQQDQHLSATALSGGAATIGTPAISQGHVLTDVELAKAVPCASEVTHESSSEFLAEQPKTQADRTIAQLIRFQNLDDDWDGSGAARPLSQSIKDARRFIRSLAPESVIPRATLHADGHAVLLLHGANLYAELEFLGQNRISFYARRDGQEWGDEFSFNGGALPVGLSQIGFVTEQ